MPNSKNIELEYSILEKIAIEDMPIGAVTIHEKLEKNAFSLSETAVSRLLRAYRKNGYLERIKNQGHILTDMGRERLRQLASERALYKTFRELAGPENGNDGESILGILISRRAIEVEAAYRAARNATDEDLGQMASIIRTQYAEMEKGEDYSDASASFHKAILYAAKIPMLVTLYNFIGLSNQWQNFFVGTFKIYNTPINVSHEAIYKALKERCPSEAAGLMADHMDKVIENAGKLILKSKRAK